MITIRKALPADREAVLKIIREVISRGDTFAYDPDTSRETLLHEWFADNRYTYVALEDQEIAGTFFFKANQPGLGNHIANAGYMTAPQKAGRGVGRAMCEYSLAEAKRLGFTAMQFNLVVKSNAAAVHLWKKMGFTVIGEIPEAYRHRRLGLTNAYIMYKKL